MLKLILALITRNLYQPTPGLQPGQMPGDLDMFWQHLDEEAQTLTGYRYRPTWKPAKPAAHVTATPTAPAIEFTL